MAPNTPRKQSIERTSEYDEFIEKLAEYHEKRGCVLHIACFDCARSHIAQKLTDLQNTL
jgi:hypothetical protein